MTIKEAGGNDKSKNKIVLNNTEQYEFDLTLDHDIEMEKSENAKVEGFTAYSQVSGFETQVFMEDIIKTASSADVQKWLSNPTLFREKLEKYIAYLYISNASVFQLFDTSFSLPTLNYKFNFDLQIANEESVVKENTKKCKDAMRYTKHKILTRQLMTQLAGTGTICALWVGTKKKPTLYIFDDLNYIFPAYQKNNDWVIWVDLSWFSTMTEMERKITLDTLSPVITEEDYQSYKKDPSNYRYIELPLNKSVYLSAHRLYSNQRLGIPWGTQSALDVLHKERLKMLEKSIANKVINSIAVLTLGETDKNGGGLYHDAKIRKDKKKVVNGVKAGLQANSEGSTPVIAIPHWSKIEFMSVDMDGLDNKKFETTNQDLNVATNGMDSLYNGTTTFSTGKLTLSLTYSKVAVMLEQIEIEVYQKLFNYILSSKLRDFITLVYEKEMPMTKYEKIKILKELASTHGFSIKAVIDLVDGVSWEEYLSQTMYEQEVLDLPNKVQPYQNAFTGDGNDEGDNTGDRVETGQLTEKGEKSRDN